MGLGATTQGHQYNECIRSRINRLLPPEIHPYTKASAFSRRQGLGAPVLHHHRQEGRQLVQQLSERLPPPVQVLLPEVVEQVLCLRGRLREACRAEALPKTSIVQDRNQAVQALLVLGVHPEVAGSHARLQGVKDNMHVPYHLEAVREQEPSAAAHLRSDGEWLVGLAKMWCLGCGLFPDRPKHRHILLRWLK